MTADIACKREVLPLKGRTPYLRVFMNEASQKDGRTTKEHHHSMSRANDNGRKRNLR